MPVNYGSVKTPMMGQTRTPVNTFITPQKQEFFGKPSTEKYFNTFNAPKSINSFDNVCDGMQTMGMSSVRLGTGSTAKQDVSAKYKKVTPIKTANLSKKCVVKNETREKVYQKSKD